MAKPSLKATPKGVRLARQTLTRARLVQKDLGAMVGCSRQPVTNFFKGEAIAQNIFLRICEHLGLDWQDIADLPDESDTAAFNDSHRATADLDTLVQQLRQQVHDSIQERCGTMRILDMSYPIGLDDIYTDVNILEQIAGRRHKRLEELLQELKPDDFDRFGLNRIAEERVPGLEAVKKYKKLILLGKPGAGKTTFLKYLAIRCNRGQFEAERLPVFVTLKDFAEASDRVNLIEYISSRNFNCYMPQPPADEEENINAFYQVLSAGRALVLLDGLDEVRLEDCDRVLKEIRNFSEQFRANHFVITCRIAAWEYTFEKFTEVEIADFDGQQIATFAANWFKHKPIEPKTFIKSLSGNSRIRQLAVSPLLLMLLCLAFEESGDCPQNRSELYKEGIDALLKKWDASRGIRRDRVYKNLSHQRKEDLLSYIALNTFTQGDYFFKQQRVEQYITDYIRQLPNASPDPETLQLDSEAILDAIEAQHGLLIERAKSIYSFSHLTFQEYFVARELVFRNPQLDSTLQELVSHTTDKRWREVFLLTTEMLKDASLLLLPMKRRIDELVASNSRLQKFLSYVPEQAALPEFSFCKPAAVRAFFLDIDFDIDANRLVALNLDRHANILVCASFLTRMLKDVLLKDAIAIAQNYDANVSRPADKIINAQSANAVMKIAIQIAYDSEKLAASERKTLAFFLRRLSSEQIDDEETKEIVDEARASAKTRHQIGGKWRFEQHEKELLKQYYDANQLLVECLNCDSCLMKPNVRQQIENTLLLPSRDIPDGDYGS